MSDRRTSWLVMLGLALCACAGGSEITDEAADAGGTKPPVQDVATQDLGVDTGPLDISFDFQAPDGLDVTPAEGLDGGSPDMEPEVEAEVLDPQCVPPFAGFLCPCVQDGDCVSGQCVTTGDEGRCSAPCGDDQPCGAPGWICGTLLATCPDCFRICLYQHARACRPCADDADCDLPDTDIDGHCISYGGKGSFCASECAALGDCPEAYSCTAVTLPSGQTRSFCTRDGGDCACTEDAIADAASTVCDLTNELGTCPGLRACGPDGLGACGGEGPTKEKCDGVDQDCDGVTDAPFEGGNCKIQNEHGSCWGVETCVDAGIVCEGQTPEAETCDGVDDDCDGYTDEGFEDTDNDTLKDCFDPDDDGDGVLDDGDGTGSVSDTPCATNQVTDCDDNCPKVVNANQKDSDGDGQGDKCDCDVDGDHVDGAQCGGADCQDGDPLVHPGVVEAQPSAADCSMCNGQDDDCDGETDEGCVDTDEDQIHDCLDEDDDADGAPDTLDNCPLAWNPQQQDQDADNLGDACDDDQDGDLIPIALGDCDDLDPLIYPGAIERCNGADDSCDGVTDEGYEDTDLDGQADCVDEDDDDDAVPDDGDGDGVDGDHPCTGGVAIVCDDNCPKIPNLGQADLDADGLGDVCDPDLDEDGIANGDDLCPSAPDPQQEDLDGDLIGDACDPDIDDDDLPNEVDNCPGVWNKQQVDSDADDHGDACDPDDDDDGVADDGDASGDDTDAPCAPGQAAACDDNCRTVPNPDQADNDLDHKGDACDPDDDNDGVLDDGDASGIIGDAPCVGGVTEACDDNCPLTPNLEQADADSDGVGDSCQR